uniref:Uncharacterized protein n=1 Tax=Lepeophtheirus salmonis TaxID=72036 RepID=A0A0K2V8E9_LEPSM
MIFYIDALQSNIVYIVVLSSLSMVFLDSDFFSFQITFYHCQPLKFYYYPLIANLCNGFYYSLQFYRVTKEVSNLQVGEDNK